MHHLMPFTARKVCILTQIFFFCFRLYQYTDSGQLTFRRASLKNKG